MCTGPEFGLHRSFFISRKVCTGRAAPLRAVTPCVTLEEAVTAGPVLRVIFGQNYRRRDPGVTRYAVTRSIFTVGGLCRAAPLGTVMGAVTLEDAVTVGPALRVTMSYKPVREGSVMRYDRTTVEMVQYFGRSVNGEHFKLRFWTLSAVQPLAMPKGNKFVTNILGV